MLKFENVEVPYFNPLTKQIGILIHCKQNKELSSCEISEKVNSCAMFIRNYLLNEGFIEKDDVHNWQHHTKIVYHPQTNL